MRVFVLIIMALGVASGDIEDETYEGKTSYKNN